MKFSLFCAAFALSSLQQHCTVCASVNRECRGAVGNAGEGLGGLLALHQARNYVAFLFSPSAKIVGACSKTWDLSTTGF